LLEQRQSLLAERQELLQERQRLLERSQAIMVHQQQLVEYLKALGSALRTAPSTELIKRLSGRQQLLLVSHQTAMIMWEWLKTHDGHGPQQNSVCDGNNSGEHPPGEIWHY
jgi:hypothetical protein